MFQSLDIEGFQSLYDIKLELDKFTVIVGPSNSGKSATVRALKTLAFNSKVSGILSDGADRTSITLTTDQGEVSYVRQASGVHYWYNAGGEPEKYTKLGGKVPECIGSLLAIDELNFAYQFEMPYLLAESGSSVARTIGDLTNVSRLFEAAREGNKRKSQQSTIQKHDVAKLEGLETQLETDFVGLDERLESQRRAEEGLARVEDLENQKVRLNALVQRIEASKRAYQKFVELDELPTLDEVTKLRDKSNALRTKISQVESAAKKYKLLEKEVLDKEAELQKKHDEFDSEMDKFDMCPLCNSELGTGNK